MKAGWPKRAVRQAGAAAVELAVLATFVLLPMAIIALEGGRLFLYYDTMVKGVRDAARYLSTNSPGDAPSIATAKCLAVYGNPACTGLSLIPGLTTNMVSVCDRISCPATHALQPTGYGVVNLVTVRIGSDDCKSPPCYTVPLLFGLPKEGDPLPSIATSIVFGRNISATMEQVL